MADTQEQALGTITPVDGDYFRAVDDPGGAPASSNVTGTALKAFLKTYFDTLYFGLSNVSYVTSDFSKTSNTTLADVTGLTYTVAAGGKYRFQSVLLVECPATPGGKFSVSGTCTATKINYEIVILLTGNTDSLQATALDTSLGVAAAWEIARIDGYIEVNAGGTLTIKFAQNVSNATASKVLTGSWLQVDKIG